MSLDFLVSSHFGKVFVKPKEGLAHFFSGMMGPMPMFDAMGMNSCMGYELPSMCDSWMYGMEHGYSDPALSYLDSVSPLINSWESNFGGSTGIQEPVMNFECSASLTDLLGNNFGGSSELQDPVNLNYFGAPVDIFPTAIGMDSVNLYDVVLPNQEFSVKASYLDGISPVILGMGANFMGDSSSIVEPAFKTESFDLMPLVNDWSAGFVGDTSGIQPVLPVNDEFSYLKPVVDDFSYRFIGDTSNLDSPMIPGFIEEISPVIDIMSHRFIGDTSGIADSVRAPGQFDYLKPLTDEMTFTFLGDSTKLTSGLDDLSQSPVFDSADFSSLQPLVNEWTSQYVGNTSGLVPELEIVPDLSSNFRIHFGPETEPVSVEVPGLHIRDDFDYLSSDHSQEMKRIDFCDFQPFNINDPIGLHNNTELDLLNIELFGLHNKLKSKGQAFGVDLNVNPNSKEYLDLLYCGGLEKLEGFKQKIEGLLDDNDIMRSIESNAKVFDVNDAILSNGIHFTPLPKRRYLGVYDTADYSIEFPLYEMRPDKSGFDTINEISERYLSKVVIPHEMSHCETIQYLGAAEDVLPFDTDSPIGSLFDEHIKHRIGSEILEVIADANVFHKLEGRALSDFVRERSRIFESEFGNVTPEYVASIINNNPEILDLDGLIKYAAESRMLGNKKMERYFNHVFSDLGYGELDCKGNFIPNFELGPMVASLINDLSQIGPLTGYSVGEARSMFIDFAERLLLLQGVGDNYLDRLSSGVDHYYEVLNRRASPNRLVQSPAALMPDYEMRGGVWR